MIVFNREDFSSIKFFYQYKTKKYPINTSAWFLKISAPYHSSSRVEIEYGDDKEFSPPPIHNIGPNMLGVFNDPDFSKFVDRSIFVGNGTINLKKLYYHKNFKAFAASTSKLEINNKLLFLRPRFLIIKNCDIWDNIKVNQDFLDYGGILFTIISKEKNNLLAFSGKIEFITLEGTGYTAIELKFKEQIFEYL